VEELLGAAHSNPELAGALDLVTDCPDFHLVRSGRVFSSEEVSHDLAVDLQG